MAKKQDRCDKGNKGGGKGNVEFSKEICPSDKNTNKKNCK